MFREGKRVGGANCRLMALPGEGRCGIATSKKIGSKPLRNRAKRRFRESLRRNDPHVNGNLDYVLIVTPQGAGAAFEAIVGELRTMLEAMDRRWAGE
ncbi:MAG: ribonuclease P protein component [Fimbriimonadaceae bacterium]|nr:ribonuclease P protein component [Fimbriimonadaceae bacterium]MCO5298312.1 ribonuclease P protein component [Fimbriimonadaceae bacterium]